MDVIEREKLYNILILGHKIKVKEQHLSLFPNASFIFENKPYQIRNHNKNILIIHSNVLNAWK